MNGPAAAFSLLEGRSPLQAMLRVAAMLEIIILFFVTRKLGAKVRARGHDALPYQMLVVVLWLVGEVVGAIGGNICARVICYRGGELYLIVACALAGAILGATIVFSITDRLPDQRPVENDHEEYEGHFDSSPVGAGRPDERYRRIG
jgi:hypothetical protein